MYHQYFGLQEAPFSIAVNPRYLYMSPRHRDALAHLLYGVGAGGGFILLTGEVGTGKTTLNRCLIEQLPDNADVAIVLNPALDAHDLLACVCEELGILKASESAPGLKTLTDALHRFLLENHARGRKTVLMIDEAQHLDFDVLEQIRLLTNLETHEEKLLHIILIGQPELAEKLARPELRQLNQRITARYSLQPLNAQETAAYVRHRLQVAGLPAGRELFSPALLRAIHRRSRGVPRLINLLCERMLLGAYGRGIDRPDNRLLHAAAAEVLGEAAGARTRLPLLLAGGVLVTVATLLWWLLPIQPGNGTAEPAVALKRDVVQEDLPSGTQETPVGLGVPGRAQENVQSVDNRDWQLAPDSGAALLGSLYGLSAAAVSVAATADPCAITTAARLRCETAVAATWDELLAVGRPLLLELVDERRFAARGLFLGAAGDEAVLGVTQGVRTVPLTELAAAWSGRYWFYWQRPADWSGTVGPGDRGASVRVVAELFAALDAQPRALTVDRFSTALGERVRLFQRRSGLAADGVAGERTLRALVLAAGADLDRETARRRLAAGERSR